ncbi:phosphoribosylformylglycinamidine synthase, partial [Vibrio parahaemolyticus AQ3810]
KRAQEHRLSLNTLQTQSADRKICAFLFWDCGSAKSKTGLYTYSLQPMWFKCGK